MAHLALSLLAPDARHGDGCTNQTGAGAMKRWAYWLSRPWVVPALALLGMLLHVPTLDTSLFADDFLQWAIFRGEIHQTTPVGSLFGLFNLVDGQPAHVQAMKDAGRLLWSAADNLHISFWRPLAEFTHWVDYQLWPDAPWLMHVHNLLWYGLLLLCLGHLYRRLSTEPTQAGLALAIYALSSLHWLAIAWLSARNQLMSACFVVLTVILYDRWRRGGRPRDALLCALALLLGLASAEASVAAIGYLLAYALTIEQGKPVRERLRALLPFLALVAVWRVTCTHLGYGSLGSGSYVDPVQDTMRFVGVIVLRLPALLLAQLLGMPTSIMGHLSHAQQVFYASCAALAALLMLVLTRRLGLWASAQMRFFGLGTLLALVPVCAIAPTDRVLIHAEIGMSALLGMVCCQLLVRLQPDGQAVRRSGKVLVGTLMTVHLLVFPVLSFANDAVLALMIRPSTFGIINALPEAAGHPDAHVVLINPPVPNMVFYYPLVRRYMGLSTPRSMWALANGPQQDIRLEVLDASTLRLSSSHTFVDVLHRDIRSQPFKPGDVVRLDMLTVTVEQVASDGGPLVVRFHFEVPMSAATWQFYVWQDISFVPFAMPAPGEVRQFPAAGLAQLVKHGLPFIRSYSEHKVAAR
jgi:hypothetical protein